MWGGREARRDLGSWPMHEGGFGSRPITTTQCGGPPGACVRGPCHVLRCELAARGAHDTGRETWYHLWQPALTSSWYVPGPKPPIARVPSFFTESQGWTISEEYNKRYRGFRCNLFKGRCVCVCVCVSSCPNYLLFSSISIIYDDRGSIWVSLKKLSKTTTFMIGSVEP